MAGRDGTRSGRASILDEGFPPPAFAGFAPAALQFFRDLAENQNKGWMSEHKQVFDREVKAPLCALVAALSDRFVEEGLPLRGDPARSIFRLNRDVRFSKNKAPYKTNASFALTRNGDKHAPGVLYFHMDPAGSFVAAGFFMPEPQVLQQLRQRLVDKPGSWAAASEALGEADLALDRTDTLVRYPKGFDAPPDAVADMVKLKSWIVRRDVTNRELGSPALVERLVAFAVAAAPLLDLGWSALDAHIPAIDGRHPTRGGR